MRYVFPRVVHNFLQIVYHEGSFLFSGSFCVVVS